MSRRVLAERALFAALKTRQDAGIPNNLPICSYDFVSSRGVDVRLMAVPSMEGMYDRASETIIISSLRPRGRREFTCAHEYAHHHFGHGLSVDELAEQRDTPRPEQELLADLFAGFLLMPRPVVVQGFRNVGVDPHRCTPGQAYRIACWVGVSYEGLLTHASRSVKVMSLAIAERLKQVSPKTIKDALAPVDLDGDLVVADQHWVRAIDVEVGDVLGLPHGTSADGSCTEPLCMTEAATFLGVTRPGLDRAVCGSWACSIRASRREYEGLAKYRHFPENTDD